MQHHPHPSPLKLVKPARLREGDLVGICAPSGHTNDAAIARAVVALAHSLGLQVVAEGVETEGQRAFLIEHGCRSFQGYLFGRPGPVADLARQVVQARNALGLVA